MASAVRNARSSTIGTCSGDVAVCDELRRDVREEGLQVDLLHVARRARCGLLAHDGDDRLAVELGVVEAVEQVDGAGPLGGGDHADAAGVLRVAAPP